MHYLDKMAKENAISLQIYSCELQENCTFKGGVGEERRIGRGRGVGKY